MERLQKVLARRGVASRRKAEKIISDGRVRVNGEIVTELGVRVDPGKDQIEVDGQEVKPPALTYLILYKPKNYITSKKDPEGRPTVMDLLSRDYQDLHPVGRLDWDTEGLLLLTNDGDLTFKLTHPSFEIEKTYVVKTDKEIKDSQIQALARGVKLEDGKTSPAKVKKMGRGRLQIVIHEGRNRQVRRMMEKVGLPVFNLCRTALAGINLDGLEPGEYRRLKKKEINELWTLGLKDKG